MEELTIARRYAKGLLGIIKDNKRVERYIQSFRGLWVKFVKSEDEKVVKDFDVIELKRRVSMLQPLLKGLDNIQKRFIHYLNLKERFSLLPVICDEMERMMFERMDIVLMESFSARKLDRDILMDLTGAISAKLGKRVKIKENIDTKKIGGVLLRLGDLVIDSTIDARLRRLRKEINGD